MAQKCGRPPPPHLGGVRRAREAHLRRCIPAPCTAQSPACAGRGRSGPAGPSASSVASSCPFRRWPSCRPTRETSWSRCRSLEYRLRREQVSANDTAVNSTFHLEYEAEQSQQGQTFLFLLLGNICYDVIHIIWHNVALLPLQKRRTRLRCVSFLALLNLNLFDSIGADATGEKWETHRELMNSLS